MFKEHGAKLNVTFFPRTSLPSIFDCFQCANMEIISYAMLSGGLL